MANRNITPGHFTRTVPTVENLIEELQALRREVKEVKREVKKLRLKSLRRPPILTGFDAMSSRTTILKRSRGPH